MRLSTIMISLIMLGITMLSISTFVDKALSAEGMETTGIGDMNVTADVESTMKQFEERIAQNQGQVSWTDGIAFIFTGAVGAAKTTVASAATLTKVIFVSFEKLGIPVEITMGFVLMATAMVLFAIFRAIRGGG